MKITVYAVSRSITIVQYQFMYFTCLVCLVNQLLFRDWKFTLSTLLFAFPYANFISNYLIMEVS